jgi:hypothetical protein
MQCLVAAVRPLRVKELAEVLAFNFDAEGIPKLNSNWRWEDQEGAVILACSSLVTIVNDEDSRIVQFSHFSVKEFLTADRLAITLNLRRRIRPSRKHALVFFSDWTITLTKTASKTSFRWLSTLLSTGPVMPNLGVYRHASGMGWNIVLMKTNHTLRRGFATWVWINKSAFGRLSTMRPVKPKVVPLYHATRLGFRDLATHLVAEHPEHVNARDDWGDTIMHAAAEGEYRHSFITT